MHYNLFAKSSETWRRGRTDSVTNWINMGVPDGMDYLEYILVSGKTNKQQTGIQHDVALMIPDATF